MMIKQTVISFLFAISLTACTYPTTTINAVDARPSLAFTNASPTAALLVDGIVVGNAASFNGKTNVLRLERGMHRIEVKDGTRTLLSQSIYLGDDLLKTINLPN